jgi:hypothetical protein
LIPAATVSNRKSGAVSRFAALFTRSRLANLRVRRFAGATLLNAHISIHPKFQRVENWVASR